MQDGGCDERRGEERKRFEVGGFRFRV
jgi:hypothetical protein